MPAKMDEVCGVATLPVLDLAASKILANSDRGLDSATFMRDIIDLAMLDLSMQELQRALQKAEKAI